MAATFDAVAGGSRRHEPAGPGLVDLDARMHDVYAEHHDRLVGFFVRRTQDRALAEDLAHDTIVRFAGAAERFDWDRPVWPYLMAVASNLLIDHQRRDQREVVIDVEGEGVWLERPEPGQDIDDAVVLGEVLEEAIARLSDRQRVAVELRCRRGWSVPDAAAFLGIPPATFNQLLYRARENLRERLDRAGARVSGLVVPALVGLRLRLREASDRAREVLPTPPAAIGVEGLASMVIATTVGVAVAVGGATSGTGAPAAPSQLVGSELAGHEVAVSTAPAPPSGGDRVIEAAPPVTPAVEEEPEPAPQPSADAARTTVVETPDAVPDSDGRVTMSEDEERFDIAYEAEATTELVDIDGDNDLIWVDCESDMGVVCTSDG